MVGITFPQGRDVPGDVRGGHLGQLTHPRGGEGAQVAVQVTPV